MPFLILLPFCKSKEDAQFEDITKALLVSTTYSFPACAVHKSFISIKHVEAEDTFKSFTCSQLSSATGVEFLM